MFVDFMLIGNRVSRYERTNIDGPMKTYTKRDYHGKLYQMMNLTKIRFGKEKSNLPMTRGHIMTIDCLI